MNLTLARVGGSPLLWLWAPKLKRALATAHAAGMMCRRRLGVSSVVAMDVRALARRESILLEGIGTLVLMQMLLCVAGGLHKETQPGPPNVCDEALVRINFGRINWQAYAART